MAKVWQYSYRMSVKIELFWKSAFFGVLGLDMPLSRPSHTFVSNKGACTNHVDRILGNFDPPPLYVDTFTK